MSQEYAPTAEQERAVELFRTGDDLAIEAGAGAGKTSTLMLVAGAAPPRKRGQYIAFNRAIVTEAGQKFPESVSCRTAHSLAMAAVGRQYAHRLNSPRMKSLEIADRLGIEALALTTQDGQYKKLARGYLAGLTMRAVTRFCQSADLEPQERHVPYVDGIDIPPGEMENNRLLRRHLIPYVRRAWADLSAPDGTLPYKHEHYLKSWHLSGPKINADFILFDECQDANPVLLAIVEAQNHAQKVWVGDSQQAIYGFTGAVNALQRIAEQGGARAFLTQSFRFGPAVAEVANRVLADLDAEMTIVGTESIPSTVGPIENPDAVLTRTNAEAIRTVLRARREGRRVHLVGGGTEVARFAKAAQELMDKGWTSHPELACFDSWDEVQRYVDEDEQGGELRLLVKLVDEFGVALILETLDRLPREEDADLIVSTAHKSKGREWDTVQLGSDFPDEPGEDELRLLYVAVTRARLALDIDSVGYLREDTDEQEEAAPAVSSAECGHLVCAAAGGLCLAQDAERVF